MNELRYTAPHTGAINLADHFKHSYEGTNNLKTAVSKPLIQSDLERLATHLNGTYTPQIRLNENRVYRLLQINTNDTPVVIVMPQKPFDYSHPLIFSDVELSEQHIFDTCIKVSKAIEIVNLGLPEPSEYGEYLQRVKRIEERE